ncbi:MAG: Abi family protein, partial [Bacteroidales bacterium]|nr:Abi family protein [Bacteroidales bacterium]
MSRTPYSKPFLPYQAQLSLLKSRGMQFADNAKALHLLEHIGYYRFSGYWYPLLADKQNPTFKPNTHFETAFNLYKFDRELRKLMISELEKVEVAVRSKMTYVMSMAHGAFWMEDASLFSNPELHHTTLNKIGEELSRSDEEFILSFKAKYSNPLPPAFITLEISSFGALSRFFSHLKSGKDKREIAGAFGLSDVVFISWLHSFVYIRNVCAHHARLWNRFLSIQPLFPRHTQNVWLTNRQNVNNRMYYVLSMMIYLLNTVNPRHTFKQ